MERLDPSASPSPAGTAPEPCPICMERGHTARFHESRSVSGYRPASASPETTRTTPVDSDGFEVKTENSFGDPLSAPSAEARPEPTGAMPCGRPAKGLCIPGAADCWCTRERLKSAVNEYARVLESEGASQRAVYARQAIGEALSITEWVALLGSTAPAVAGEAPIETDDEGACLVCGMDPLDRRSDGEWCPKCIPAQLRAAARAGAGEETDDVFHTFTLLLDKYLSSYRGAVEAEADAGPHAETDSDTDRAYERSVVRRAKLDAYVRASLSTLRADAPDKARYGECSGCLKGRTAEDFAASLTHCRLCIALADVQHARDEVASLRADAPQPHEWDALANCVRFLRTSETFLSSPVPSPAQLEWAWAAITRRFVAEQERAAALASCRLSGRSTDGDAP